jgi:hypothetical protein
MVHIRLSEHLVGGGIREVVGAIGGMVINEDMSALNTSFILIKQFAFRIEKLWALFVRGRGSSSGREHGGRMGDVCVIVAIGDVTRGGFVGVAIRCIPILFCDPLVFLPFGTKTFITVFHLVQPFTEVHNFFQLFGGYLLGQPNLHTCPKLLTQFVI